MTVYDSRFSTRSGRKKMSSKNTTVFFLRTFSSSLSRFLPCHRLGNHWIIPLCARAPLPTYTPSRRLLMSQSSLRVPGAIALAASLSVASAARPFTARALLGLTCDSVEAVDHTSCATVWTDTRFDKCVAAKAWNDAKTADATWATNQVIKSVKLAGREAQDAIDQVATGRDLSKLNLKQSKKTVISPALSPPAPRHRHAL